MTNSEMIHQAFTLAEMRVMIQLVARDINENPNGIANQQVFDKLYQALLDY